MPSTLGEAGFYASNRLRLLPATNLPTDSPLPKKSLWLLTVTPDSKSVKKKLGVEEFVYVYVPFESTKVAGWEFKSQVRVLLLSPGAKVLQGFEHTVQVVNPSSLVPVPAAQLFASVRLLGTRNGPGQLMAVQAIVASYDAKSKFKKFQYWLDQAHNKPPVVQTNPDSKEWTKKTLERIDVNKIKLHDEENLILNLVVGTRLWLQVDGVLHAGLVMQPTGTFAMELVLVRAESENKEHSTEETEPGVAANATGAARTGAGTRLFVSMRSVKSFLTQYALLTGQADSTMHTSAVEHVAGPSNKGGEESTAGPSAFVKTMDLSNLVLGDSLHVVLPSLENIMFTITCF